MKEFIEMVTSLIFGIMVLIVLVSIAASVVTTYYPDGQLASWVRNFFALLHELNLNIG